MIKHLTDVRGELAELLKFVCVCARAKPLILQTASGRLPRHEVVHRRRRTDHWPVDAGGHHTDGHSVVGDASNSLAIDGRLGQLSTPIAPMFENLYNDCMAIPLDALVPLNKWLASSRRPDKIFYELVRSVDCTHLL